MDARFDIRDGKLVRTVIKEEVIEFDYAFLLAQRDRLQKELDEVNELIKRAEELGLGKEKGDQ